jgi:hypothetical protein
MKKKGEWYLPARVNKKREEYLTTSEEEEIGMSIRVRVPNPIKMGTGMIFYPRMLSVAESNRDGYMADIFFIHGQPNGYLILYYRYDSKL